MAGADTEPDHPHRAGLRPFGLGRRKSAARRCCDTSRAAALEEAGPVNPLHLEIIGQLEQVELLRQRRLAEPALARSVHALKSYQHGRFEKTYADLLTSARYAPACRFFLEELYSPTDFTSRDQQFSRVVPALVRLFPRRVVETVARLARLHALSERLDLQMAQATGRAPAVDAQAYVLAWRAVGEPRSREEQIQSMLAIGRALDDFTRLPMLRRMLHAMRGPARAAHLEALQGFLERGFDTFADMKGSAEFLRLIEDRERRLAGLLFGVQELAVFKGELP